MRLEIAVLCGLRIENLKREREIQVANLADGALTPILQQTGDLQAEGGVIKQKAAYIQFFFMLDIEKYSIDRFDARGSYLFENSDFALRPLVFCASHPRPDGRPVGKAMIGHQWMLSQSHEEIASIPLLDCQ